MRIIFKITNFDSKIIEVKICRISSHKPIDEYFAKTTNITQLDFTNFENLVHSIVKANINRINLQDEKEDVIKENIPDDINEVNLESLKNKVIEYDYKDKTYTLLNMNRVNL
jgi:hypothetical protein|tara:strand:- start:209 stop:544 length:336 start_codon:yes stop_codon:yes gene_type:complete